MLFTRKVRSGTFASSDEYYAWLLYRLLAAYWVDFYTST